MTDAASRYYDQLETRDPAQRAEEMMLALPGLIRHAVDHAPAMARHLEGVEPDGVTSMTALAALPVLRKCELRHRQAELAPFGGLTATPLCRLARVFMSPGPIFEVESPRPDYWRLARALYAAGFRAGDLVHNSFAYHLTPAGAMMESGARALSCPVIPAGTGNTERQLEAIRHLHPVAYTGTPSFLKILLERARDDGGPPPGFAKALVSGEAFPASLAGELESAFGLKGYQCYATADLGLIAYETTARDGLVVDEAVLVELVRPGTDVPVPDGEPGEVVVTSFNPDYPLIRFATGDISAFLSGPSPCGRTNRRLKGWLGRADQATKVRGMFVHPHQVSEVVARHPGIAKARLLVERDRGGHDAMTLLCEPGTGPAAASGTVADSLRVVTGLRGEVLAVAPGSLADDGKVIDDRRDPD